MERNGTLEEVCAVLRDPEGISRNLTRSRTYDLNCRNELRHVIICMKYRAFLRIPSRASSPTDMLVDIPDVTTSPQSRISPSSQRA